MIEDSLEKEFLQDNFYGENWENLKLDNPSIVNFSFLRNLFEKKLFDKDFGINWHDKEIIIKKEFEEEFTKTLSWVKNRYKNGSKVNILFSRGDKLEFDLMLNDKDIGSNQINIKGLLSRAYRLRNNYFHGEKDLNK